MRAELQRLAKAAGAVRARTALGERTGFTWAQQLPPRPHGEITGTIRAMPGACFTVDDVVEALPNGPSVDRYEVARIVWRMRSRGQVVAVSGSGMDRVWQLTEAGRIMRKQGRAKCSNPDTGRKEMMSMHD